MKGDVTFHLTKTQMARINKALEAGRGCKLALSPAQIKHCAQHGSGRFTDLLKDGFHLLKPVIKQGVGKALDYGVGKAKDFAQSKIEGVIDRVGNGTAPPEAVKIATRNGTRGGLTWGGMGVANMKNPWHPWSGMGLTKTEEGQLHRMAAMHGEGFFGDLVKKVAHGGIDFLADKIGGGIAGQSPTPVQHRQLSAIYKKHGKGFFGDLVKKIAHGGVDVLGSVLGGSAKPAKKLSAVQMERLHELHGEGFFDKIAGLFGGAAMEPNEALRKAIFEKKVPIKSGSGLNLP